MDMPGYACEQAHVGAQRVHSTRLLPAGSLFSSPLARVTRAEVSLLAGYHEISLDGRASLAL